MTIFYESGFEDGKWAGALAKLLRKKLLIPGLVAKGRIWRGDWKQWIQYENPEFRGSLFWIGKPAIRSNKDFLFAGYYIEKGLANHEKKEYVITNEWHWHGFIRCLIEQNLMKIINNLIISLPVDRRCYWIETDELNKSYPYTGEESLNEMFATINNQKKDLWINVMVGIFLSKQECLTLQEKIVRELQNSIIRASDIDDIVKNNISKG
mgnify:CR=1 FL=1